MDERTKVVNMRNREDCDGKNDFLDDVLDGKPFHMVTTPQFRRDLRRRAAERWTEDMEWLRSRRIGR